MNYSSRPKICRIIGIVCLLTVPLDSRAKGDEPNLPSAAFPPFRGAQYTTTVPDTLDLAERLKLSLNALTRCVGDCCPKPFPPTKYLANHFILLDSEGPKVIRNVNLYGKAMLGALLARMVTGSDQRIEIDNDWRASWLQWQKINPVMHGPEGGRRMEWMAMNIRRETGSNRAAWRALVERTVNRLDQELCDGSRGAWLLQGHNIADDGFSSRAEVDKQFEQMMAAKKKNIHGPAPRGWMATHMTWTLQGLCALYRETGDENILRVAGRLARYLKDEARIIAPDGRFLAGHEHEFPNIHWHHSFQVAIACAEYGLVSNDDEYLKFANIAYQHGLSLGSREIGFAPEYCYGKFPRAQDFDNTEACCTSDLILIALWLSLSGEEDYWDDIDRFVRNQLAALQLTDTRWFYKLPENRGKWTYPDAEVEARIGPLVGNFGGWSTPNEWHIPELGCGIMTCCLGNCTRAMYYVWEQMVQFSDHELSVHLMLNRASPWADFHSYRPNAGKLQVQVKKDLGRLRVRAPEWVAKGSESISVARGDAPVPHVWEGRYVVVNTLRAGEEITFSFPTPTKITQTTIGRRDYTLTFRGNTVVELQPPGTRIPLYMRAAMQTDKVPMRRVERYLAHD